MPIIFNSWFKWSIAYISNWQDNSRLFQNFWQLALLVLATNNFWQLAQTSRQKMKIYLITTWLPFLFQVSLSSTSLSSLILISLYHLTTICGHHFIILRYFLFIFHDMSFDYFFFLKVSLKMFVSIFSNLFVEQIV